MRKRNEPPSCFSSLSDTEEGADDAKGVSSVTVAFHSLVIIGLSVLL